MQLTGLDLLFWAAGFVGHITLLYVLWRRHRATLFPVFTTLITANVIRTVTLYFTLHHTTKHVYFITYWSLAILDVSLQLAVVYEVAEHVFRPLGKWARDVRHAFILLIGGCVAIASGLTWLAAPATHTWREVVVIRGNFFSSALMSELFVGMLVLSVTIGLPWQTHVARIAQGLGVYSVVGIVIDAGHSYFGLRRGTQMYITLSHVRIATYLCCLIYWTVMLWRDAPEPRELPEAMRRQLFVLQRRVAYDLQTLRIWRR